jgi:two-component system vancomycin resistance associated response regulator VraR
MGLTIAILDEYELALHGMCDNLKNVPDFEVVGAFAKTEDMIHFLEEETADIVVLDLMLKGSRGIEVIEKIREVVDGDIKIIALVSGIYEEVIYEKALHMGVRAFLQEDTSYDELVRCISDVGKGTDAVPDFLLDGERDYMLSQMETAVLRLIADEYTTEKVAGELDISRRTVETHVKNICTKLGVEGRVGAVREAVRLKLV